MPYLLHHSQEPFKRKPAGRGMQATQECKAVGNHRFQPFGA